MPAPSKDLLRGTLDALVLKTLSWGPRHGYAIIRWLEDTAGNTYLFRSSFPRYLVFKHQCGLVLYRLTSPPAQTDRNVVGLLFPQSSSARITFEGQSEESSIDSFGYL